MWQSENSSYNNHLDRRARAGLSGAIGCINELTDDTMDSCSDCLMLQMQDIKPVIANNTAVASECFAANVNQVSERLLGLTSNTQDGKSPNRQWNNRQALLAVAQSVLSSSSPDVGVLSLVFITGAVALKSRDDPNCRAVASALTHECSASLPSVSDRTKIIVRRLIFQLLVAENVDLHIVCALARLFQFNSCSTEDEATVVSNAVHSRLGDEKQAERWLPSALNLAAQLRPWSLVAPTDLILIAVANNYWDAAERLAGNDGESVIILVRASLEAHMYRLADKYATSRHCPDHDLKLQARYLHVCSTLNKLIRRGAWPLLERQVLRVDEVADQWKSDPAFQPSVAVADGSTISFTTVSKDIRLFALEQLTAQGKIDVAKDLAASWNMPYGYNADDLQALLEEKRKTYIQWNDLHHYHNQTDPPDVLQTPEELRDGFASILEVQQTTAVFGFDAEWEDGPKGLSILQIASGQVGGGVVLIDIPKLASSIEGAKALRDTVGHLFATAKWTKVGFACSQDIQRLRSVSSAGSNHWLPDCQSVVDLKSLVPGQGLSRCCEKYLGKPLDKSEQCSLWTRRPLTQHQRIYAALDALTCAVIFNQLNSTQIESEVTVLY